MEIWKGNKRLEGLSKTKGNLRETKPIELYSKKNLKIKKGDLLKLEESSLIYYGEVVEILVTIPRSKIPSSNSLGMPNLPYCSPPPETRSEPGYKYVLRCKEVRTEEIYEPLTVGPWEKEACSIEGRRFCESLRSLQQTAESLPDNGFATAINDISQKLMNWVKKVDSVQDSTLNTLTRQRDELLRADAKMKKLEKATKELADLVDPDISAELED